MEVKDLPPYVTYEAKAELAPDGKSYVDVHYAYITPVGSKDRFEFRVDEWLERLKAQVAQGRFSQQWLDAFKAQYNAWRTDQDPPINGTSIKLWSILSPAQTKRLTELRVLAIEDLAQANEETIGRIGMGGRALQQQARDYLKAQEKGGLNEIVKAKETLLLENEALKARNAELEKQISEYKAVAALATAT